METSYKNVNYFLIFINIFVVFVCWKISSSHMKSSKEPKSSRTEKYAVVFSTTPSMEVARALSHKLVQANFAACVNIIPQTTSVYKWKSKVEEETEVLLVVKTKSELVNDVIKFVKENHPYEVPEVISLGIKDGYEKYLAWIDEAVKNKVKK